MRCLGPPLRKIGMMRKGTVETGGIGIDQQLGHIETMPLLRLPRAIGAQAIIKAEAAARLRRAREGCMGL